MNVHFLFIICQDILIDFNFLKDAYRVDVAIQTDSIFITYDRLAFIYYNLIVKWEKKDNKSLFILNK